MMEAIASDETGIDKVVFTVDDIPVATVSAAPGARPTRPFLRCPAGGRSPPSLMTSPGIQTKSASVIVDVPGTSGAGSGGGTSGSDGGHAGGPVDMVGGCESVGSAMPLLGLVCAVLVHRRRVLRSALGKP